MHGAVGAAGQHYSAAPNQVTPVSFSSHHGGPWHWGWWVFPVGCTVPRADRPAHHHQLLGPSHDDGLWSLSLSCCPCCTSGLPCWCFPRDRGQHQDQTWGLRARTSHISSFVMQGQQPLFHEGKTLGLGSLQLSTAASPVKPLWP